MVIEETEREKVRVIGKKVKEEMAMKEKQL